MTLQCNRWASPAFPRVTCYRVLLWQADAIAPEAWDEWLSSRAELLTRMQEAGIKGARAKLRGVQDEMRELSFSLIESPLLTCDTCAPFYTRVNARVDALQGLAAVLGYQLQGGALILLLDLQDDRGLDALLADCQEILGESTLWCTQPLIEAMDAESAFLLQQEWRKDAESQSETAVNSQWQQMAESFSHVTVLAKEASEALCAGAGKQLVDATLGGGGHTQRLLEAGAEVWGIDQDPVARQAAATRLAAHAERLHVVAGNFRDIASLLQQQGLTAVDGILADIGISSPQVDCAERGFSFLHDGPLDMRMNLESPYSAADLIATESEAALADILWQYGEERASRAIARRIVRERDNSPITRTSQLADIIASVLPRKGKQHPATRSFQALRIAVNDELGALNSLLEQSMQLLRSGGRLAIITFHSLEDRAVKRYFERITRPEVDRPEWPAPRPNPEFCARLITRKPLVASEEELSANPRSRSAKLRVVEKI